MGSTKGKRPAAVGGGLAAATRAPRGLSRSRRGRAGVAAAAEPGPSRLARKILGFTRCVAGTGIMAILAGCTVVVMFAPHIPGVNVCNTEFDWVRKPLLLLHPTVNFVPCVFASLSNRDSYIF